MVDVNAADAAPGGSSASPPQGRRLVAQVSRERSPHRTEVGAASRPPHHSAEEGDGFKVGEVLMLGVLASRPDLEHKRCKVVDIDPTSGRLGVVIEDGAETIRVNPGVLSKCSRTFVALRLAHREDPGRCYA